MPSFISSFNRVPMTSWRRTLIMALTVGAAILGAMELILRINGVQPTRNDDPRRWSYVRKKLTMSAGQNTTALLGASRIQLGWSMKQFRAVVPDTELYQLAVDGFAPLATMQNLADDRNFIGVVVISLTAGGIRPDARKEQLGYVSFYKESWNLNSKINFLIDDALQVKLVTRSPRFGLAQIATNAI